MADMDIDCCCCSNKRSSAVFKQDEGEDDGDAIVTTGTCAGGGGGVCRVPDERFGICCPTEVEQGVEATSSSATYATSCKAYTDISR